MSISAVQEKKADVSFRKTEAPANERPISWKKFEKEYLGREDEYKYEWVRGYVEKTNRAMEPYQIYLQRNLLLLFHKLLFDGKVHGQLIAEGDLLFFKNLHRRPDMSWLTDEQTDRLAEPGAIEVPLFLIEVISKNDSSEYLENKMDEYRAAGVQAVWHIFPRAKAVHVYTGNDMREMTVCKGDDLCSAAPALPGFTVTVNDIFKKIKKPA